MVQQKQEVAFVLKRFFPRRQMVALFTCSLGRINVVLKQQDICLRLWPGMLITCVFSSERLPFIAQQVVIHSAPIPQTHQHIIWLHHILELCYYFLPLESSSPDVFFYIKKCCCLMWQSDVLDVEWQIKIKKTCVIKLLHMIGFYAALDIQEYSALFQELSDVFVDFTNEQKVAFLSKHSTLLKINDMDLLILSCLKNHPMFHMFKTISFNYQ